jgi:hypothetical protein
MAATYIQKISLALKEYKLINDQDLDELRNTYYPDVTIDDFYSAMAWAGLTTNGSGNETTAWHAFKVDNPSKATKYLQIITFERIASAVAPSHEKCN